MTFHVLNARSVVQNALLVLEPKTKLPVIGDDNGSGVIDDVAEELARKLGSDALATFGSAALLSAQRGQQDTTELTMTLVVARKADHDEFMRVIGEAKRQQYSNGYSAGVAAGVEMGKSIAAARLSAILEAPGEA